MARKTPHSARLAIAHEGGKMSAFAEAREIVERVCEETDYRSASARRIDAALAELQLKTSRRIAKLEEDI